MYAAKSTLFLAFFAASTQLVAALPPACLLAAVKYALQEFLAANHY